MIQIVTQKISRDEVCRHLGDPFEDMIKFVVDLQKEIMTLGGRLHSEGQKILLEKGSRQEDLWGGNWYPNFAGEKRIEYTSMINVRPQQGNKSIEIQDPLLRQKVKTLAEKLLA